jgi:nucleotide-binding universal stress UspA family protein
MTKAPFASRLLVGLNGQEPDVHLIRYASMVARLNQSEDTAPFPIAPGKNGTAEHTKSSLAVADPEVRFVYLFPSRASAQATRDGSLRSWLRTQVKTYFTALSDRAAIGYDVLKGNALGRLSSFATDFDSDLLLLGQSTWPPKICARIAMEAPCPVWLVPPGWAPVLRRLLVPCDFSERSAAALQTAIEIARRSRHAKCLVLHAYWSGSRFTDVHTQTEKRRQLDRVYEQFMSRIDRHGVAVEPLFVEAQSVDRQIERAAAHHGVDLVVMWTRGRTRSSRLLLPSNTDLAIRRCPTSFLVLPTSGRPVGLLQALCERLRTREDAHFS